LNRGYTMVEVMAALAILTVGATGVIAMQKASQLANQSARNLSTANAVAESWVERLRADAIQWNNPGGLPDLSDTTWLKQVTSGNGFFTPQVLVGTASNAADIHGADLYPGDPEQSAFCTHIALTQIYPGTITATVRTVWIRSGRAVDCNQPPATIDQDANLPSPLGYGMVYMTTAINNNVLPGG
jgi:prepilin-type N-terminal cleavage/methylation domain-containing protein